MRNQLGLLLARAKVEGWKRDSNVQEGMTQDPVGGVWEQDELATCGVEACVEG